MKKRVPKGVRNPNFRSKDSILYVYSNFASHFYNFLAVYHSKKGVEEMRDQLSQVMKTSKKISERQVTDTLAWFETAGAAPKVNI